MVKFDAENDLLAHPSQYYTTTTLLEVPLSRDKGFSPRVNCGIAICQFSCMTLDASDTHS